MSMLSESDWTYGRFASETSTMVAGATALDGSAISDPGSAGEGELVARLRHGEDGAFEELVRLHGGRLLATARRFVGSDDEARDVVQETFLSAFRGIGSFAGSARLSTWLHSILINAARMRLRTRRRRPLESIEDLLPRFDDCGEWAEGAVSSELPDALLERRQARDAVRTCIDRLPERHRTVVLLRDVEDRSTEEVAEILGTTTSAVKLRLHRARQALRTLLERELGK
jgi:RNA polymerase sigma-70 factor (ECF subfamily)